MITKRRNFCYKKPNLSQRSGAWPPDPHLPPAAVIHNLAKNTLIDQNFPKYCPPYPFQNSYVCYTVYSHLGYNRSITFFAISCQLLFCCCDAQTNVIKMCLNPILHGGELQLFLNST